MDTQTNDDVLKSDFFSRLSKMIPHKQRDTGKFYPISRNFRMNVNLILHNYFNIGLNCGLSVVLDICILGLPIENVTFSASVPNITRPAAVAATPTVVTIPAAIRSEEHTSELQSRPHLVCRLLLE